MNVYEILKSKANNLHYLNRYFKFINDCEKHNSSISKNEIGYVESHHICPKAEDLFPEYSSFARNPWNKIALTTRQHYIAHYFLHKCFGGSQTYAFWAMTHQKGPKQKVRYDRINSRIYEKLKREIAAKSSTSNKGKASYIDSEGNKIRCNTNHPKVLSGEYTAASKGRSIPRSEETKKRMSISARRAKHNANKKKKLYFLDIRIEVLYHSDIFPLLLEQGWSSNRTKEYRIKQIQDLHCGKKRSSDTVKKISKAKKGKVGTRKTKQQRLELRKQKSGIEYQPKLYYDTKQKEFKYTDLLFEEFSENLVDVFTRGRLIWNAQGERRWCNENCPTPSGYYESYPLNEYKVYDLMSRKITIKLYRDINLDQEIILKVPKSNRIKVYCSDMNMRIFLSAEFISEFGIPVNCRSLGSQQ